MQYRGACLRRKQREVRRCARDYRGCLGRQHRTLECVLGRSSVLRRQVPGCFRPGWCDRKSFNLNVKVREGAPSYRDTRGVLLDNKVGIERTTFVITPDDKIVAVLSTENDKIKMTEHSEKSLAVVQELAAKPKGRQIYFAVRSRSYSGEWLLPLSWSRPATSLKGGHPSILADMRPALMDVLVTPTALNEEAGGSGPWQKACGSKPPARSEQSPPPCVSPLPQVRCARNRRRLTAGRLLPQAVPRVEGWLR